MKGEVVASGGEWGAAIAYRIGERREKAESEVGAGVTAREGTSGRARDEENLGQTRVRDCRGVDESRGYLMKLG